MQRIAIYQSQKPFLDKQSLTQMQKTCRILEETNVGNIWFKFSILETNYKQDTCSNANELSATNQTTAKSFASLITADSNIVHQIMLLFTKIRQTRNLKNATTDALKRKWYLLASSKRPPWSE